MSDYNLSILSTYSDICDEQLDHVIADGVGKLPNAWIFVVLWNKSSFHRVRESQNCVDPEGAISLAH